MGKLVLVVAHDDDGAFLALLLKQCVEFCTRCLIEVRFGFVEEQQVGTRNEGSRQERALPLSAAEVRYGALRKFFEVEGVQHFMDAFAVLGVEPLPEFLRLERPESTMSSTVVGNCRSMWRYCGR